MAQPPLVGPAPSVAPQPDPRAARPWNFGLRGMVLIVAGLAAIFAAYRFRQENLDTDRAVYTIQRRNLDSVDPAIRLAAVQAMGVSNGPDRRPAIVAVTRALDDPDAQVRRAAAVALMPLFGAPDIRGELDDDVPAVAASLLRHLDDDAPEVRGATVRTLGALAVPRSLPSNPSGLYGPPPGWRIPRVGPDPARVVPALKTRLLDRNAGVRHDALIALARLIPDAGEARRFLIELADSEAAPELRGLALRSLWETGPGWSGDPEVVGVLVKMLRDPNMAVRSTAESALTGVTTMPPPLLADLAQRVEATRDDARNRRFLAGVLARFADDPEFLRPLLRDDDPIVRSLARGALGMADLEEFGPEEPEGRGP